jgi:hypothetical protein
MKKQQTKIIKEFAGYFDQELQTTLPISVLPAIPTHAAIAVPAPMCTLWAICTKLSIMT